MTMSRDTFSLQTRRELLSLLGVSTIGSISGCLGAQTGPASDEDTPTQSGSGERALRGDWSSGSLSDAETLLHHQIGDSVSGSRVALTLDGAYTFTPDNEVFPLWLDLQSRDDEGREYEAVLRDNLYWSDPYGQMTAEDWVFHIQEVHQAQDNWTGSQATDLWSDIQVEQTGDLTFSVTLSSPNVDFPLEPVFWGAYCYPKRLLEPFVEDRDLEGIQQNEELNSLSYTGNLGPYSFERWDREAEFVAVRNEDYYMHSVSDVPEPWTEAPYFNSYTYNVIPEESSRLAALRTGEITAAGIPFPRVSEFQSNNSIYLNQVPQAFLTILAYNQRMNGWEELRTSEVRQALSTAVNKDVITEQILRGYANTTHTFQPQWSDWYDDSTITEFGQDETYSYDRAKELLAEYTSSEYSYDNDELVNGDGEQVELTFVYAEGSETVETTAEWVAQELEQIGLGINLELVSFDRMIQQYIFNSWQGGGEPPWNGGPFNAGPRDQTASQEEWDLMYGVRFNTYPRTPAATDSFWTEKGSANYFGYVPEVDHASLFQEARATSDREERLEIFNSIFGRISRDQPVNFVAMQEDIVGYQDYVVGPEPRFGQGWNSVTWYFAEA